MVLALEEAVQLVQVRDLPPQELHLGPLLGRLLLRPFPQQARLALCLLPRGRRG